MCPDTDCVAVCLNPKSPDTACVAVCLNLKSPDTACVAVCCLLTINRLPEMKDLLCQRALLLWPLLTLFCEPLLHKRPINSECLSIQDAESLGCISIQDAYQFRMPNHRFYPTQQIPEVMNECVSETASGLQDCIAHVSIHMLYTHDAFTCCILMLHSHVVYSCCIHMMQIASHL